MKSVEKSSVYDPNLFLLVPRRQVKGPPTISEVKKDIEAVDLAVSRSTISAAKLNVAETARKARLLTLNLKEI
jgi:hypothetical protein